MFQDRYKKAMLRIAIQLGKAQSPLSMRFWDLSKKKPVVAKEDIEFFIWNIKFTEECANERPFKYPRTCESQADLIAIYVR